MKVDTYVWGEEVILWGDLPEHSFTVKILKPKPGKAGCLSLQYHNEKSETWQVISGAGYALYEREGKAVAEVIGPGKFINLPAKTIHRLMGKSEDFAVLEYSTLDAHAKDPSKEKDVIRLHCVHGREVSPASTVRQAELIRDFIELTEKALSE